MYRRKSRSNFSFALSSSSCTASVRRLQRYHLNLASCSSGSFTPTPPPPHSSSEGCPAERECLHHRLSQCHWLQQWVPHDILRFRTRCGTPGSRASSGRLPQRVFCPSYIKVHTAPFNDKLRYIMLTMIEQVLKRKSRLEIKPRTFDPCTLAWCEAVTTVHEKRSLVSQYSKFETFLYVNRREECL